MLAPRPSFYPFYQWFTHTLTILRWATLGVLLIITLILPSDSLIGLPSWTLVILFSGHSLIYTLLGRALKTRVSQARILGIGAVLDLLAASLVYFVAGNPGGPFFVLFFFAINFAIASLTLRGAMSYIGAVAAIVATTDILLSFPAPTASDWRMIFVRMVIIGLVGAGMAILTKRLRMEQMVANSAVTETQRLEEVNKARSRFISSVSHDLGTPLTAARAGLSMVEATALDRLESEERSLLSNARRNIERLSILLDDLLTFNKIEAGVLQLESEGLDLRLIVMDSLSAVYPLFLQKGQTLEIDMPEALPYVGDVRQLEQVVVNLLANAHRHTQSMTRITILGRATAEEILITISDNGSGIRQEELDAIFNRYYRSEPSDEGSGLGLAIAKAIVEMHGGRIWAESIQGKGASFHAAFPYKEKEEVKIK